MSNVSPGALIFVCVVVAVLCGLFSSAIAKNKGLPSGGYFFLGLFLGVIGIVIAACVRGAQPVAAPLAPGWYPDPWGEASMRYNDGTQWTGHVHTH